MSVLFRIICVSGALSFGTYLSSAALACTVCGVGKEESRLAFIITTGILTFVPLIMVGFIANYIWRQVKQRERATEENPSL